MAALAGVQYIDSSGVTQTVNYYAFSDTDTRYFIDTIPSGNIQDNKRFSIPGINGNFVIRSGFRGLQVQLIVRYKGTLQVTNSAWQSDREAFAQYSCSVTDGNKFLYSRCTLRPDSGQRITEEMATGQSGNIWFDVRYVFDVEEL